VNGFHGSFKKQTKARQDASQDEASPKAEAAQGKDQGPQEKR
jgi:hypothetical protein